MNAEKLRALTLDLRKQYPRSPRETLAGYVHAGRLLDKCRAAVLGCIGEYHYDCPLDRFFFEFTGIAADAFKAFVATGASDGEVGAWIERQSRVKERREIVAWNNRMRDMRLSEMPLELQLFLEDYIPKVVPRGRTVRVWFDVYDLEEGRL